jgi:hypothetical protein
MVTEYHVTLNIDLTHNTTTLHHKAPHTTQENHGNPEAQSINWKRNTF